MGLLGSLFFFLYCLYTLLQSALGGGLGRPRRSGIPSPEGVRRMTNSYIKVLHFDLESSGESNERRRCGIKKNICCLKKSNSFVAYMECHEFFVHLQ